MKLLIALAGVLLAGIVHAVTIKFPDTAQRAEIESHLDEAERTELHMISKRWPLQWNVAIKTGQSLVVVNGWSLDKLLKEAGKSREEVEIFKREYASMGRKRDLERNKAIHRTLTGYGIVPVGTSGLPEMPIGTIVLGHDKGRKVSWIVTARENKEGKIIDAKGKRHTLPKYDEEAIPNAVTYSDGITAVINWKGVKSPAHLALLLLHEKVHFEQFTTAGKGDRMVSAERELEAYKQMRENIKILNLEGDSNLVQNVEKLIKKNKRAALWQRPLWKLVRFFLEPKAELRLLPHVQEEFDTLHEQFDDLARVMAEERRFIQRERGKLKRRLEREKIERRRQEEERQKEAERLRYEDCAQGFSLGKLSKKVCETPGGVTQYDIDSAIGGWFPNPDIYPAVNGCTEFDEKDLTGCPGDLFVTILHYNQIWNDSLWPEDFLLNKFNEWAPPPVPGAVTAIDIRPGELAILAEKACAAPGSIGSSDLKSISDWFPNPNIDKVIVDDWKKTLTGCAKELYLQFLDINRRWSKGGWVVDLDRTWKTPKGRIIRYQWINSEAEKIIKRRSKSTPRGGGGGGGEGGKEGGGYPGPKCMQTRCVDI